MGDERKTMQQYLDALTARADYGRYFTDDVVVTVEGSDQRAEGREAGEQLIRYMHEKAFDARPELKNLLVDEGKAAIEADFAGTHTGEFAGVAPTGRAVRVPYSVIYDLRGDQISKLRTSILSIRRSRSLALSWFSMPSGREVPVASFPRTIPSWNCRSSRRLSPWTRAARPRAGAYRMPKTCIAFRDPNAG